MALEQPITNARKADRTKPHATLGQLLGESGYDTFAVGKWHNGTDSLIRSFHAGERIMLGGMSSHFCVNTNRLQAGSGKLEPSRNNEGHSTEQFTSAAEAFLRTRSADDEKPFFLYVAYTAPHDPRETHWRFRKLYEPKSMDLPAAFMPQHPFSLDARERDEYLAEFPRQPDESRMHEADYYAMITHLDEGIGRIHAALEQTGQLENTIVVHTADHGIALGRHGLMGKQNLYDHSIRIPLIVAGPGFERGVNDDRLCHQHDLFPTLLDRAGARRVDSDFADLQSTSRRESVGSAYGTTMRTIRDARLKLIEYRLKAGLVTQLFDTESDPAEINDLSSSSKHQRDVARLRAALKDRLKSMNDPFEL